LYAAGSSKWQHRAVRIVDCAHFVAGGRVVEPVALADAGALARGTDGFVWVALSDPADHEVDELGRVFGVQPSAPNDTPQGYQRPKLEHHGERTTLAVKTPRADESTTTLDVGAVEIFIGGHYAIAIGTSSADALDAASARLTSRPDVSEHGPMAAAWAVLDAVIEGTERALDTLGDQLERIQVAVFQGDQDQSEQIYRLLQEAARLTRAMHPMLTIFDRLQRGELIEAPPALSPLLGDLSDHARRLSEEVMMLGEALEGLLNANLARVTVRQNVIIQQVSAWAAIAAVATIITGIYGMNFRHMPELGWVFGYPLAIAIIAVIVVVLRWYFKRVGWL
jgi:magnesium transporter